MPTQDAQPQPAFNPPAGVLPAYEAPAVVTFTDEQLLETLGPAQAARYVIP
jgi:hypothetical protein